MVTKKQQRWNNIYRKKNPHIARHNSYRGSARTFTRKYANRNEMLSAIEMNVYYYIKQYGHSEDKLLTLLQNATNEIKINGNKERLLTKLNAGLKQLRNDAKKERAIKREKRM